MKKLSLVILTIGFMIFSILPVFAAAAPAEVTTPKLIVNGKTTPLKDKPLLSGTQLYLPLKTLAVNLGIPDKASNIQMNNAKKTYILILEKNKLLLTLNSKKATLNGKAVTLAAAPMLYKNGVYLPADNVAKLFGKKVVWSSKSNIIAICSEASFKIVKEALQKSDTAMAGMKYKSVLNIDLTLGSYHSITKSTSDADIPQKLEHTVTETNENGVKGYKETYTAGDISYLKKAADGNWYKTTAQESDSTDLASTISSDDVIYAGLAASSVKASNELVLEGDVDVLSMFEEDIKNDNTFLAHSKIVLDNTTYAAKKLNTKANGSILIDNAKYKYSSVVSFNFTQQPADFQISLPEEFSGLTESTLYENADLGVSFYYPSTWNIKENVPTAVATFTSPTEAGDEFIENVIFSTQDLSKQPMTLEEYTDNMTAQLPIVTTDFKLISSKDTTLGGITAHQIVYSFVQGKYTIKGTEIYASQNDIFYFLCYSAEETQYDTYANSVDQLFKSFSFE